MRTTLIALTALLVLPLTAGALPSPAPASTAAIVAQPGATFTVYATVVAAAQPGAELTFVNADIFAHDVVSRDFGPDGAPWCTNKPAGRCPLFWSARANIGQQTPVLGLDRIEPGNTYTFYCTLHTGMEGTLVALPEA